MIGKNRVNLVVCWCGRFLFLLFLDNFHKTLASGQKMLAKKGVFVLSLKCHTYSREKTLINEPVQGR